MVESPTHKKCVDKTLHLAAPPVAYTIIQSMYQLIIEDAWRLLRL